MQKEITADQLHEFREKMNSAECATKIVSLSSIELTDHSIIKGEILIGGQSVRASNAFFQSLVGMLKLNRSLATELMKNEDGKVARALINGLKDYRSSRHSQEVMLIANPTTREVVDVCDPTRFRRMSNDSVFDITERVLNDNSNLTIETIDWDPRGGKSVINLLNNKEIGFPGAGKDEFFKFGFSIVQTPKDTIVEMYNQRLVCSNGLRVSLGQGAIGANRDIQFEERFKLGGTTADDIRIFLNNIEAMQRAEFVPSAFDASLNRAVNTKASLLEVENAMVRAQSLVRDRDPDTRRNLVETLGRKYFHAHADTMARIVRKGQDTLRLGDKQKSFIQTGMSIWDVVNSMTFLGSNNSGLGLENQHVLKEEAGRLFAKGTKDGYDLQFAEYARL